MIALAVHCTCTGEMRHHAHRYFQRMTEETDMNTIRIALAATALAAALGTGGFAVAHEPDKKAATAKPMQHAGHEGMNHSMAGMSEGSKQLHTAMMQGHAMPKMTGNVDTDFATMMTMHHQQALKMADVQFKYGKNAQLRALAQKMKAAQLAEIRQMAPYTAKK